MSNRESRFVVVQFLVICLACSPCGNMVQIILQSMRIHCLRVCVCLCVYVSKNVVIKSCMARMCEIPKEKKIFLDIHSCFFPEYGADGNCICMAKRKKKKKK